MAITLGALVLNDADVTVREKLEEVGGRDARVVTLSGIVAEKPDASAVEAALDAIVDAASVETFETDLVLRPGRRLKVRRLSFAREVSEDRLVGGYTLELEARNPFEDSISASSAPWTVTASGQTIALSSGGNADTPVMISMTASGDLVKPTFSDGVRTLTYSGTVPGGSVIVVDGEQGLVLVDGDDETPYASGAMPRIAPEGTTLTFTDDVSSNHSATGTVAWRDRWW